MAAKRWFLIGLLLSPLLGSVAMAVETPSYTVVLHEGAFEVRDYPALVVAEVTVQGDQKEAAGNGFRMLAGYIFGGNKQRRRVAMTAPVTQQASSEKIAMTAPVEQTQATPGTWVVRFTMPRKWSLQTLPVPDDPRVELRETAPARFAVLRFSGLARPNDVRARSDELRARVEAHGLRALGPVSLAQYNPPWTPWFMRRNEVMVKVDRAPPGDGGH
jgi:hypothetical protein